MQYLVVLRTNLDELPLGLFGTRVDAMKCVRTVTQDEANKAAAFMGVDCAGRINLALIEFTGTQPTGMEIVADWDDEAPHPTVIKRRRHKRK